MSSQAPQPPSRKENIAQALNKVAADGDNFMNGDLEARERLIESARELIAAAEAPVESLLWHIWALPTRVAAARVAVELKLFETAVQDNGRAKTNEELAAPTGASPALVKRIARACVSMRMLDEQGPDLYVPNDLTRLLAKPEYAAGITFNYISQLPFAHLPTYLKERKFQNPEDTSNTPFQYAYKCGSPFDWLSERPELFEAFHKYLHTLRVHRPRWTDMYPVQERLVSGLKADGDASAFIDMGGGTGQILQDFRAAVPQYTGRLVLQEIPHVIATAKSTGVGEASRIELQIHDFFTPQPLKGARAYFMRSVLHDWSDEQCRTILGHLKDAMEPGYSRILISEFIIADEKAAWQHVALDMFMMVQVATLERTEREWRELIESCGLKVAGVYNKGEGNEGLIEIVL